MDFPEFRSVTVFRPNGRMLGLHWSLRPHAWDMTDLAFVVFRSTGPTGPWEEIGVAEPGRFEFTDTDVVGAGIHRSYYFIVRCASVSQQGYSDSPVRRLEHDPDHIALEMIRKKNLFLLARGGIAGAVVPRKSWGAKCSRCYNYERGLPEDPDCPICYGTGFTGGYLNPVLIPMLFNPPRMAIVNAGLKYEPHQIYVELANWPIAYPHDVVVDRVMNIRYRIDQVTPTSHRMHIVSQVAMLLRVDENDVLYDLPIPGAEKKLEARSWDLVTRGDPHEVLRNSPRRP